MVNRSEVLIRQRGAPPVVVQHSVLAAQRQPGKPHRVQWGGAASWVVWPVVLLLLVLLRHQLVDITEGHTHHPVSLTGVPSGSKAAAAPSVVGAGPAVVGQGAQAKLPSGQYCDNSCFKANDGVCDEGRPVTNKAAAQRRGRALSAGEEVKQVEQVQCDLGTDCNDCGVWNGTLPDKWDEHAGPVAWLRARKMSMYVRHTATPRPFLAAITHQDVDPDVSAMLWNYGAMEGGVTRILHWTLQTECSTDPRIVLDVGANFGYYTIQAALYGCRVVAFEPVRSFRPYLDWAIHANGVAHLVTVRGVALSDKPGLVEMVVPKDRSYWGLASVNGVNVLPNEAREKVAVNASTLDDWATWAPPGFKPQDIVLLKLDLEGWEAHVLMGGQRLLRSHVDNILTEYSPGVWERFSPSDLASQRMLPHSLRLLTQSGFRVAHLPLFAFAAPWPPKRILPNEALPMLEEVTEQMLTYDLEALDARKRLEAEPGGCLLPPELRAFGAWKNCREWTYGAHPKGFRSAFGFNTNVWAARDQSTSVVRGLQRVQGTAALFGMDQDMKVWHSQRRPGVGMGLNDCKSVGGGHLVLFHCPCGDDAPAECKQQQDVVNKLIAEGKMLFVSPLDNVIAAGQAGEAAAGGAAKSAAAATTAASAKPDDDDDDYEDDKGATDKGAQNAKAAPKEQPKPQVQQQKDLDDYDDGDADVRKGAAEDAHKAIGVSADEDDDDDAEEVEYDPAADAARAKKAEEEERAAEEKATKAMAALSDDDDDYDEDKKEDYEGMSGHLERKAVQQMIEVHSKPGGGKVSTTRKESKFGLDWLGKRGKRGP